MAEKTGDSAGENHESRTGQDRFYSRLSLLLGIFTAVIGATGLLGQNSAIIPFGSLFLSYFSIAFSTALIWIFFGAVLAYLSIRPDPGKGRFIIIAGIVIIAIIEALEIPLNILGIRAFGRPGILTGGVPATGIPATPYFPGGVPATELPVTPYFPVSPLLIIAVAIALLLLVKAASPSPYQTRTRDALGITGGFIAVVSLLFHIGFLYGVPFLSGTPFIPVGIASAFAGFCTGSGLVVAAGPSAVPLRYFTGNSVRSQMLRAFVPLVFIIFLLDNIIDVVISAYFNIQGPLLFSLTAVIFALVASFAFGQVSKGLSARLDAEEKRRKRSEDALREANKKLNLLNSITRHDILNQLMVIDGYLEIFQEECRGDEKLVSYFDRVIQSTKMIERQISFTKFYQELGVQAPDWHRVQIIADNVSRMVGFEKIRFTIETGEIEIYADPLFEKVFFNLFDNAVRHGEHVSEIRILFEQRGTDGILIVEDNGIGISDVDKPQIFRRGYGKHTGFGLFLTREILAITGITILETGEPGHGARFEITVPGGEFRLAGSP